MLPIYLLVLNPWHFFWRQRRSSAAVWQRDRWFRVNQPISSHIKSEMILFVISPPIALTDVNVYAKPRKQIRNSFTFSKILRFIVRYNQPISRKKWLFIRKRKTVNADKIEGFSSDPLNLHFNRPLFSKFKKIKSNYLVQFQWWLLIDELGNFPMNPVLAKEAQ
jgi:hypothetical protein